jgi:SulP family sulfate permease
MKNDQLKPKLFSVMKTYTKEQFVKDVISGIIVAIIALPLSIALALASGVGPEQGIYTAVIAGFLISFFGGSRVQIAGPTAAFATIVAGIVARNGMSGLATATVLAGILLIIMGVLRLGTLIKFIPYTITTGFTAGIAVTILVGQLKDFFGLTYEAGVENIETLDKIRNVIKFFGSVNLWAVLVGVICLLIQIVWPKISQKIPGSLIAVIVGILIVKFGKLPVNTIGDLYQISAGLPTPVLPDFSFHMIRTVFSDAVTIAILAAIESLLSCVVADGMIGSKHRSNMELVAQGIGNMGSAFFGGIPATGAIARTAANIKNGGRTPIAGMVHSLVLVLVLVVLMPYAAWIPMPTIAAILFLVAYNMCQYRAFVSLCKTAPKSDILVLVVTFVLTVCFDLVVAIEVGMILAGLLFMKRMSDETEVRGWKYSEEEESGAEDENDPMALSLRQVPKQVRVYEINGPMFFGMTDLISDITLKDFTKVLIIRMRGVPALDASAMRSLEALYDRCAAQNVQVLFSHVNEQPRKTMEKDGFIKKVGEDHFCQHIDDALEKAKKYID